MLLTYNRNFDDNLSGWKMVGHPLSIPLKPGRCLQFLTTLLSFEALAGLMNDNAVRFIAFI